MKGVSRENINMVVMMIVITLFLVTIVVIFREQLGPFVESLRNIFKDLFKVS